MKRWTPFFNAEAVQTGLWAQGTQAMLEVTVQGVAASLHFPPPSPLSVPPKSRRSPAVQTRSQTMAPTSHPSLTLRQPVPASYQPSPRAQTPVLASQSPPTRLQIPPLTSQSPPTRLHPCRSQTSPPTPFPTASRPSPSATADSENMFPFGRTDTASSSTSPAPQQVRKLQRKNAIRDFRRGNSSER